MLRLREIGLIRLWEKKFEPDARPCWKDDDSDFSKKVQHDDKQLARLTLANLAGPFALLAAGYMISVVVFFIELIVSRVM